MISFKISLDSPAHFTVLIDERSNIQMVKNPALTAYLPFWLQQDLANQALRQAIPSPPRKVVRRIAEVVELDALRQAREERVSKGAGVGT